MLNPTDVQYDDVSHYASVTAVASYQEAAARWTVHVFIPSFLP